MEGEYTGTGRTPQPIIARKEYILSVYSNTNFSLVSGIVSINGFSEEMGFGL